MRFVLETGIGLGLVGAAPMALWMAFLAFVSVSQTWLITGTALALIFSLSMIAAAVMADFAS